MNAAAVRQVVLIADDDPLARLIVEAALEGAGYTVLAAEDGAAALQLFEDTTPDCVLLDVMMPGVGGFATCRAIRARPDGTTVPVLMLTSRDDVDAIANAYAAGATDFAQKGLSPRLLAERVRFLLRTAALQRGLAASEARLAHAQRMARLGHWELGIEGETASVSPVLAELLDLPAASFSGRDAFIALLGPDDAQRFAAALEEFWRYGTAIELDLDLMGATGLRRLHVEGEASGGGGSAREPTLTLTLQDVTRLRRAEEEVRALSFYDPATRQPNRRFTRERLRYCLRVVERPQLCAVIVLRIGDVERVIGSFGSSATEELLRRSAARLEEALALGATAVRRAAALAPFVAHFGDGEFVVVLPGCESARAAESVALELIAAAGRPLRLDGEMHSPSAHAGIAVAPDDGSDADSLLERARTALRQVEAAGGDSAFYSAELQGRSRRRLQLEGALVGAAERGELHVEYQPRVDLQTLEIVGAEALVRWRHPQFGDVAPDEFVPVAEESGAIWDLGRWVLETAVRCAAAWPMRVGRPLALSVNLSARQVLHPLLERTVETLVEQSGLPPGRLELELTETSMIQAGGLARAVLERLRARGVHIAIDDFGTGYSSLGYLGRLPVNVIKIDRSFARGLPADPAAQGVVSAVLGLARSLRARTVAEGIESPDQLTTLLAQGCDEGQGFLFAPALPAEEFEALCRRGVDPALRYARDRAFA
jgi:predicted signal transduction protein with EAL and GGDEF domain/DNA-binding response OmpR family regulator